MEYLKNTEIKILLTATKPCSSILLAKLFKKLLNEAARTTLKQIKHTFDTQFCGHLIIQIVFCKKLRNSKSYNFGKLTYQIAHISSFLSNRTYLYLTSIK